ncbi:hypothetical protein E1A91_A02G190100v1 [Gossypium mustelinum]|uniref:Uncharacterized protein n=1 Tax=Gossypium mustelinum TaxID=34275 RepID=A0A5D3A982_GOSMU|nr:hypothetical protein E1A91_A02G190100v1 [Gossypium mustelinum]
METPCSSTRRVTRSQTLAALNNSISVAKESEKKSVLQTRNGKEKQEERSALIDITNDSPIVGLAMGTPSSNTSKQWRPKIMMMMTPGSGEALLRGQIKTLFQKDEESEKKSVLKTRNEKQQQQERPAALIDVRNDSPIIGLAMGTPLSETSKQWRADKMMKMMTPGSGEALLRSQVKTLLQKVEEEEPEVSNVPSESCHFLRGQSCVVSPMGLVAPTPANTPQIEGSIVMALPVVEENLRISEVVSSIFDGVSIESEKSEITRSLLVEFSEKSETSEDSSECCYSVLTDECSASKEKVSSSSSIDDDNSSVWSIQVNASTHDEDEETTIEEMGDDYHEDAEEMGDDDDGLVDELCEGLSKMSMEEMFQGKHTRFIYSSDEEIEEECAEIKADSSDIIRLKGLPTPKGKHLRFPLDD